MNKQQQSSDWAADTLTEAQLGYAASDVLHLHRIKEILDGMLAREERTHLAEAAFRFLLDRKGESEPEWLAAALAEGDPAAAITERARAKACSTSLETLDLFFALLGAEAGNLSLKFLATGGVFLLGGILPKLLPELESSSFLACFEAKGRHRSLLSTVPVYVVVDEDIGLRGAAAHAQRWPA